MNAPDPRREGTTVPPESFLRAVARVGVRTVVTTIAGWQLTPRTVRFHLLRWWGVDTRTKVINPGCFFSSPNVAIGARTTINWGVFFEAGARITIGDDCGVGIDAHLMTRSHEVGGPERRIGTEHALPVTIEDGCWIGARVIVQPGVTVGSGCIVAAGAVVTKDCEPNGFYAGVPARRVRELPVD